MQFSKFPTDLRRRALHELVRNRSLAYPHIHLYKAECVSPFADPPMHGGPCGSFICTETGLHLIPALRSNDAFQCVLPALSIFFFASSSSSSCIRPSEIPHGSRELPSRAYLIPSSYSAMFVLCRIRYSSDYWNYVLYVRDSIAFYRKLRLVAFITILKKQKN